jgi:DNA-binding Lrp family transcriptional regulator
MWGSPGRWNVRKSYAEVAKKLGVDEETVRNRIKHLKESGVLAGWRLIPSPSLFGRGLVMQYLGFRSSAAKESAISRLEQMPGVIVIASLYGTDLLVTLFDDERRSSSRNLRSLSPSAGPVEWTGMGLPATSFRMTPTDWQIVGLMLRNAERRVDEVASVVRVSSRTVKRRLDGMMAASAAFVMPMIDQAKSTGISYQLVVESKAGCKSEVDGLVTSRVRNLVFKSSDSGNTLIFGFTGKNVAEGKELLDWISRQSAVQSAKMNIVERVVYVSRWLEGEIRRLAVKQRETPGNTTSLMQSVLHAMASSSETLLGVLGHHPRVGSLFSLRTAFLI